MGDQGRLTIEAANAFLDSAYTRVNGDLTPGQYVMLAITDTGCGMSPEMTEKVFEPFFTTKPEGKGTGLGLSMVYGFVKQSGGHVKIYSEPDQGTTVRLYLPRSTRPEDVLTNAETGPIIGGSETILVAEDDGPVRETAVAMLGELGYRVLKAKDAQSALTIIESGLQIDLLFTDVVMPGSLKSPELARKARERLPDLAILFTSGYTENSIVHGGRLDAGVNLLGKPYTREALAKRIRHLLSNRAQAGLAPASPVADATPPPAGLVILACEDDELIRMNTVDTLQDLGYTVVEAATATEALAALQSEPIDILLTDVGLPDMSGVELARRAVQTMPSLGVIFATGHTNVPGADAIANAVVLTKPFGTNALSNALSALVRQE
jgi:CheY-like chemotaxis protein